MSVGKGNSILVQQQRESTTEPCSIVHESEYIYDSVLLHTTIIPTSISVCMYVAHRQTDDSEQCVMCITKYGWQCVTGGVFYL